MHYQLQSLKIREKKKVAWEKKSSQINKDWSVGHIYSCGPELENVAFKYHYQDPEQLPLPLTSAQSRTASAYARIEADPRELGQGEHMLPCPGPATVHKEYP